MNKILHYLSVTQVLAIHDQMIKRFGGSHGVRDLGLIKSAIARPQASFDGDDLYKSIFDQAAALLHSLLKNHPFIDGNKRTALASTGIFLVINGYTLQNKHKEEVSFTLNVVNDLLSLEEISKWLEGQSLYSI